MEPRQVLEERFDLVRDVCKAVWRRQGGRPDRVEDFLSYVSEKLVENDYARIRAFNGESRFKTYLFTVVARLLLDYRSRLFGRWRNTAVAAHLGAEAMELERLIARDGLTFDEAVAYLRDRGCRLSDAELETLAGQLPLRRRPRQVNLDGLDSRPAAERADREVIAREALGEQGELLLSLRRGMSELEAEDQLILKLRFWEGISARRIGEQLGLSGRQVFSRVDRCKRALGRFLKGDGFDGDSVEGLLGPLTEEGVSPEMWEDRQIDPSTSVGEPEPRRRGDRGGRDRQ